MPLTYTTIEAIANRLRGRAVVGGAQSPFGPSTVDDNLLRQVGEQVEARVEARLRQVYRLPLQGSHPILASIVEKGVLCELLGVHSMGQQPTEQGSFGALMCRQFNDELAEVISGAINLQGEVLAGGGGSVPLSNITLARQRRPGPAEAVEW